MIVGVEQAKLQFFDRQMWTAKERAQKRVMSKFGAYVRSDAKQSMRPSRPKKKVVGRKFGARDEKGRFLKATGGREVMVREPSRVGHPPKVIEGQLKKFIFFLYNPHTDNVIIGPIKLGRNTTAVPGLHEHGGTQVVQLYGKRTRVGTYKPRPFMQPAGEKNLQKLGDLWRDAIR